MLQNPEFYGILKELIEFGIARYRRGYSSRYRDTNLVLYQKYTYEDACRLLDWENNEVPLNIGGYKYDKISKEFYYLGRMTATGRAKEFVMANTDKTAVEIEWALDTPVREEIYQYIVNG